MNPKSSPSQTNQPYTNGHYKTPLEISGVSLHPPAPPQLPTTFAPDLPLRGLGPFLYGLNRFEFLGLPASRYIAILLSLIALLAFIGIMPGRWYILIAALLLLAAQLFLTMRFRRRQFVSFVAAPSPLLNAAPLSPTEKLPVFATGLLNVEGRYLSYCAAPGFYRTFATGEHAILCRIQERSWLGILHWPADEVGMWYAFIHPSDIQQLSWGTLHYGSATFPALAVEYSMEIPPGPRRKKSEIRQVRIYLWSPEQNDFRRLYVDLLNNLSADKIVTSLSESR